MKPSPDQFLSIRETIAEAAYSAVVELEAKKNADASPSWEVAKKTPAFKRRVKTCRLIADEAIHLLAERGLLPKVEQ